MMKMRQEKRVSKKLNIHTKLREGHPFLGREKEMKEEKEDQENYFALRLGRRHHPPMNQTPFQYFRALVKER